MTDNEVDEFSIPDVRKSGSLYGAPLLPKVMQKPIGTGSFVGLLTGIANSLILPIPLLFSVPAGVLLGVIVCVIACPGMRSDMAKFKDEHHQARTQLLTRKGRKNAFTMHE